MVSLMDIVNSNEHWNNVYYNDLSNFKGHNAKRINLTAIKNGSGETEPSLALFDAIKNQRYRQALLLIQGGTDVNCRNETGESPLMYVSKALNRRENKKMRQKFAKMLLDCGANPNLLDLRGSTALMQASIRGQEDLVQLLLANDNTDITLQDKDGNTSLMHAARQGHVPVVQSFMDHFLKRELDVSLLLQRNNQGKNALELAKHEGKTECVRLLTNFLTQFNTFMEEDQVKRSQLPSHITKAKSLDSITMDQDAALMFQSFINGRSGSRRGKDSEFHRDAQSDGFESELRNRMERLASEQSFGAEMPDYCEEIWQQETMSWFSRERDPLSRSKSGRKSQTNGGKEESIKLPPIGSKRLIDYKTWCEMGPQKDRRGHSNS